MNELPIASFRDLMNGQPTAEIKCAVRDEVVRRLRVKGENLEIDALTVVVEVPLDASIYYEPWCMDRGSLLFDSGTPQPYKICTELDVIEFPNGEKFSIVPKNR